MPVATLILYLAWFLLAFGVRTAIALRRTGDSGWRGLSGRPLSIEWNAGALFTVALAGGVAAPVAALAGVDPTLRASVVEWIGVVVAATGILLTFAAQLAMGDSWRIGVDRTERMALVIGGAFAIVRNPIFTAIIITATGLALMVLNVVAILSYVALLIALQLQVRGVEEPYLAAAHGDDYRRYAARVGRFQPRLGRGAVHAP